MESFMSPRSAWLAACLTLAVLGAAQTATAATVGDPQRGAKLAYTCHGCHGIPNYKNAYPNYAVPKLGGQHAAYLAVALRAYASQERAHATMHSHAATLTDQDIADMSAYLAGVEIKTTGKAVGAAPKASQTCIACHGNDGVGILPEYPILSGQHADYLAHALRAYRSGQRKNAVMAGMAAGLTDQDILELAEYYSKQRPSLCSTDQVRKDGKCKGL
jgi:cytochrome c553